MTKPSAQRHADQIGLFEEVEAWPVLAPTVLPRATDFNRFLATLMSEAIRSSGKSREQICALMTEMLGYEDGREMTVAQLNAYTAPSRDTHTISAGRLVVFVRATDAPWVWAELLKTEGLTVLEGKEAHLARAALYRKRAEEMMALADAEAAMAPSKLKLPRVRR